MQKEDNLDEVRAAGRHYGKARKHGYTWGGWTHEVEMKMRVCLVLCHVLRLTNSTLSMKSIKKENFFTLTRTKKDDIPITRKI